MIVIINRLNRDDYTDLLDQMYRQRYDIFIKRFGWDLPNDGVLEIDEYDTDDAVYILSVDDEMNIKASMRLCPTMKPHLMADKFAHLCFKGVPTGPSIMEVTRFYSLDHYKRDDLPQHFTGELRAAMLEYALSEGLTQLTCIANLTIIPNMLKTGYDLTPLGLPILKKNECIMAYAINVTHASYIEVCENNDIDGPLLPVSKPGERTAA
ncbi:isovaleryl-homoserine lactone synthase [Kordiimonas sediminis]|uniref:Acyl-homoserine-lactone synthase n=1 Tax=Kordiimonas sediminis TaxID=1735581 RepID=A0A919E6T4_9PROT|nr:acyl-homoserine-lactone synthase [Kordiimonas sediminis]GHF24755.1 isovaleryl-homoserine lactone synthase [Kordiimonas sediminis]